MNPEIQAVISGDSPGCVITGDCLEVMAGMPDKCVDAVVTDPPYGINIGGAGHIGGAGVTESVDYGKADWDRVGLSAEQWAECCRVSVERVGWGYNHLSNIYGLCASMFVWDKKCQNGWCDKFSDHESAFSSIGKAAMFRYLWMGALRRRDEGDEKRHHPTQKPIALMVWCLGFVPNANIILDPFCGSGTTLVAAKKLGRRYIGIEISEKYCQIARDRLEKTPVPLFIDGKENVNAGKGKHSFF